MRTLTAGVACLLALIPLSLASAATDEHVSARATANLIDNEGQEIGQVVIRQGPNGTLFNLELEGLPPGPKAIHIHSVGTCDDHDHGFQDSGGHLNPEGRTHGLMNPDGPDAGDFTNFYVHDNGYAWAELFNERASLDGSFGAQMLDDDGAALVIHENPDDHVTQPIGGAGARIACGVIVSD
ncbi:Cu-Zn family superoxide dismutase [Natronocella acetinitrilica]|uniref:Superoxide dismutase [Cu-Zn] n=1 Tax=Natronocella acetinitrilica TaxID=414046 RepID=A0AAE3G2S4_9GAMM|nr:superoxide dismutase family protein [Natronocella acetinitrilica]MCP1673646.1 Cu-Zn family superoxide dismutase [Natronocella acetinitrilica]